MDKSGHQKWINFVFVTRHLFKELMEHVSLVQMRKLQMKFPCMLPQHTSMWVASSGQACQVTSHLIRYWFARNLRIQITGKSFWETCPTFTTYLSPSFMWALKSQGKVNLVFFLTWNTWFLHKHHPVPNTQGVNHSQLTSNTVSVELVLIPQVEGSILSWLQISAMCSRVTHALDQVTKSGSFHGPTSMLNISIKPATELMKTYTYCPQNNIQEKTQKWWNGRAIEGKERVEVEIPDFSC